MIKFSFCKCRCRAGKTSFLVLFFLYFVSAPHLFGQDKLVFTLEELVARTKALSPASLRAETVKENKYWNYRFYQSNFNPQLRLGGTLPGYSRAFTNVIQPDGSVEFREVRQNLMDLELGVEQMISPTGGVVSINSSTNRFDNFLAVPGTPRTQWSGVPVNVRFIQPIFAFNPLKWDKKIEPLLYEESKREFVEEMENISRIVTELFFDYLIAQVNQEIASKNLQNTQQIYEIEKARYLLGATYEDKLLQVELQVLQAKQDLAQAGLDLETNALRIKSYAGLNENAELILVAPESIPQYEIPVEEAIEYAFSYRAVALGYERRKLEAESLEAQARGERINARLNASYGLNNAALDWRELYVDPNRQTLVNLGFVLPVLDWGRNKARMGQAKANRRLVDYTVEQESINFEQEIFTKVRNFSLLKNRLAITQQADQVADKRYELSLRRYQNGDVSITDLNIAQEEKDRNRRAYIQSLRDFWAAYYEIRQLTLYDFKKGQLLYEN